MAHRSSGSGDDPMRETAENQSKYNKEAENPQTDQQTRNEEPVRPDRQTIYENCTGYSFTAGDKQVDCSGSDSDYEMGEEVIQEACNQMEYTRLYDTDSNGGDHEPLILPKSSQLPDERTAHTVHWED